MEDCTDLGHSWSVLHDVAADRNSQRFVHLLEKIPRKDVDFMVV